MRRRQEWQGMATNLIRDGHIGRAELHVSVLGGAMPPLLHEGIR